MVLVGRKGECHTPGFRRSRTRIGSARHYCTHLPRVSAKAFGVDERRPDPLELQLDVVAADQVAEQVVFKRGAVGGADTVLRVEVLRQELWVQSVWDARYVMVERAERCHRPRGYKLLAKAFRALVYFSTTPNVEAVSFLLTEPSKAVHSWKRWSHRSFLAHQRHQRDACSALLNNVATHPTRYPSFTEQNSPRPFPLLSTKNILWRRHPGEKG